MSDFERTPESLRDAADFIASFDQDAADTLRAEADALDNSLAIFAGRVRRHMLTFILSTFDDAYKLVADSMDPTVSVEEIEERIIDVYSVPRYWDGVAAVVRAVDAEYRDV